MLIGIHGIPLSYTKKSISAYLWGTVWEVQMTFNTSCKKRS